MAYRIPFSREQYFDADNNQAYAGAKMYTFITLTNTDKTTWTSADEATPHANPIVADANGIFPEIYGDGQYKIRIFNNDDTVLLFESDPIEGVTPNSIVDDLANNTDDTKGSSLVGHLLSGISAFIDYAWDVANAINGLYNRDLYITDKRLGADETGVSDSTAAFTLALSYLETTDVETSGGRLMIPKGTFLTDALTLGAGANRGRMIIQGVSMTSSIIKLNDSQNTDLISIDDGYIIIKELHLDQNRDNNTAGSVIKTINSKGDFLEIHNVRCRNGAEYGFYCSGPGQVSVNHSFFFECNKGAFVTNSKMQFTNGTTFEDCDNGGLEIQGSNNDILINVSECYFENNGDDGVNTYGHIDMTGLQATNKINIRGSYINGLQDPTSNAFGVRILSGNPMVTGVNIEGNNFKNCEQGFDFSGLTAGQVGENTIKGNNYTGTTVAPASALGFDRGEDTKHQIWVSEDFDISTLTSFTMPFLIIVGTRALRIKSAQVFRKTDTVGTFDLDIGRDGAVTQVFTGTIAAGLAETTEDLTLVTTEVGPTDETYRATFDSSAAGVSGLVNLQIEYVEY